MRFHNQTSIPAVCYLKKTLARYYRTKQEKSSEANCKRDVRITWLLPTRRVSELFTQRLRVFATVTNQPFGFVSSAANRREQQRRAPAVYTTTALLETKASSPALFQRAINKIIIQQRGHIAQRVCIRRMVSRRLIMKTNRQIKKKVLPLFFFSVITIFLLLFCCMCLIHEAASLWRLAWTHFFCSAAADNTWLHSSGLVLAHPLSQYITAIIIRHSHPL